MKKQLILKPAENASMDDLITGGGAKELILQTEENLKPNRVDAMVRRDKSANGWRISDGSHMYFEGHFHSGVMVNGEFVNEAPPMTCSAGYDSTGEAVGNLYEVEEEVLREAFDLDLMAEIRYDKEERIFKYAVSGKPIVSDFTWLVFLPNGSAYLKA